MVFSKRHSKFMTPSNSLMDIQRTHLSSVKLFHLAHGTRDFNDYNILIDPNRGAVTGIIDWEMAGFRSAWLAAVGGGWFDDDSALHNVRFPTWSWQLRRRNSSLCCGSCPFPATPGCVG